MTSDAELAAVTAAAAMNEVLSNSDLLCAILCAPSLCDEDVACAELVCVAWARAVARNDYWCRALAHRFPSALPDGGAAAAPAAPREEVAGAGAARAASHASPVHSVTACRSAHDLVLHTQRGLVVERLDALAAAGEANGPLRATLVVERRSREWAAAGAIETAPLLLDARVGVCTHAEDGYALLGVLTQCCSDDAHGGEDRRLDGPVLGAPPGSTAGWTRAGCAAPPPQRRLQTPMRRRSRRRRRRTILTTRPSG
jgi:hypothetical protein